MLPNPGGHPPHRPGRTRSPKDRARRIPGEAQSPVYSASTGSRARPATDQVAGPRRIRLPDHGAGARTTRAGGTDRGADAIPLRAPAAHLEPKGQGSTNTDGAQSAGVRRPDWITSVSRTARLPGPGVATHGSGVHQLLGPGSPPTDCALPVACSMHVVIWLVHASNGGCFRSFAR
jgi:hypothetical protein